jgi:hypothetical protein
VAFDRSSFEFFEESGRERGKREERSSQIEIFCSRIAELDLERKGAFFVKNSLQLFLGIREKEEEEEEEETTRTRRW